MPGGEVVSEAVFKRRGREEWFFRAGVVWRRGPCCQCGRALVEHPALTHAGTCLECREKSAQSELREAWRWEQKWWR